MGDGRSNEEPRDEAMSGGGRGVSRASSIASEIVSSIGDCSRPAVEALRDSLGGGSALCLPFDLVESGSPVAPMMRRPSIERAQTLGSLWRRIEMLLMAMLVVHVDV